MGSLALPSSGLIYCDSDILIYSVETHALYWPVLEPMRQAATSGAFSIVSSELAIMETLIGPLQAQDARLTAAYDQLLQSPEIICCGTSA